MGDHSAIEWTEATWNPTTGCSKVSPGCDNCYAIHVGARLQHHPAYAGTVEEGDWTGKVNLIHERLDQPLRWRRPRMVFVDSMSDLFHQEVGSAFIAAVFDVMARADQHTFQVLTKRPQRMSALLRTGVPGGPLPLFNVWLGTSIESDRYTFRADHLRATPAAVRFLSLEPLLGPLPSLDLTGIDWVIVGGESGPRARPMHPDWVRQIRDRCAEAGIPFFFKQWGEYRPRPDLRFGDIGASGRTPEDGWRLRSGCERFRLVEPEWACGVAHPGNTVMERVGKKAAGRQLDGRPWGEMPEVLGVGA